MRNINKIIFFTLISVMSLNLSGKESTKLKGFKITVNFKNCQYDSIYIQSFNYNEQYHIIYSYPFNKTCILQGDKPLDAGFYIITASENRTITFFLISDNSSQQFEIDVDANTVTFKNSKENCANENYIKVMENLELHQKKIEEYIKNIQIKEKSIDRIEKISDSIFVVVNNFIDSKNRVRDTFVKENKKTLLASMIEASYEMRNPQKIYYSNVDSMENYYIKNFFYYFPWHDFRVLNTIIAFNKFRHFAYLLSVFSDINAVKFVDQTLMQAQINKDSYFFLFNYLSKSIANQNSPQYIESIRIAMLKNILSYNKIDNAKRLIYCNELQRLNKNNVGAKVPDFKLVLSTNDTTTFYNIKSDFTILYLQNPECPTCKDLLKVMSENSKLTELISNNKITVLTVYFEKDENLWKNFNRFNTHNQFLHGWNFDNSIESNQLYDIQYIPYLFLLDRDKTVLVKDLRVEDLGKQIAKFIN